MRPPQFSDLRLPVSPNPPHTLSSSLWLKKLAVPYYIGDCAAAKHLRAGAIDFVSPGVVSLYDIAWDSGKEFWLGTRTGTSCSWLKNEKRLDSNAGLVIQGERTMFWCYRQHNAFSLGQGANRRVGYYASESDMISMGDNRGVSSNPTSRTTPRGGTSLITVSGFQAIE